ncbi:hypothetical protein D9613_003424 [Agrocybe pediades]|uniref:Uncharacterized protein n=1 Tax=Agrocybe pediades TaxID=84607 RepID=A0A8H4QNN6_9AGAR|nr:hypothetical protein D9613_003424 [Agrocybe pediades]
MPLTGATFVPRFNRDAVSRNIEFLTTHHDVLAMGVKHFQTYQSLVTKVKDTLDALLPSADLSAELTALCTAPLREWEEELSLASPHTIHYMEIHMRHIKNKIHANEHTLRLSLNRLGIEEVPQHITNRVLRILGKTKRVHVFLPPAAAFYSPDKPPATPPDYPEEIENITMSED